MRRDKGPPSTPATLTREQHERVRHALIVYAAGKAPHDVASPEAETLTDSGLGTNRGRLRRRGGRRVASRK